MNTKDISGLNVKKLSSNLIIDVDYFKIVNDTYGHAIGDLAGRCGYTFGE